MPSAPFLGLLSVGNGVDRLPARAPLNRLPAGVGCIVLVRLIGGNNTRLLKRSGSGRGGYLRCGPPGSAFVSMVIVGKRRRGATNNESGHVVKNLVDLTAVEFASDIVSL